MTFPLRGPFVDVHAEITPVIATEWGLNISRAVDGTAGGTWIGVNTWQGAQTFSALATFNGITTLNGAVGLNNTLSATKLIVLSGVDAGICYRAPSSTLIDADADLTIDYDTYYFTAVPSVARTYTLRHTLAGSVPTVGQRIRVVMPLVSAVADAIFKREDATEVGRIVGSSNKSWIEFEYVAAATWKCVGGGGADFRLVA